MASRRGYDRILVAIGLFVLAQGCSGGGGCSCAQPLPNGFPSNERHANSIQARVSDHGVQFLEDNASTVINGVIPGGLSFAVGPVCSGNPTVCCDEPPGYCQVVVDMDPRPGDPPRLELTPNDPPGNDLGVLVRARVRTAVPMPIDYDTGWFTVSCDVTVDTEASGVPSVTITTDVTFNQDATAGTTAIGAGPVTLTDLDNGDISLTGGIDCAIADLFKGIFIGQIQSQVESLIQDTINQQVCKQCTDDPNCAPFATCDTDGICQIDEGGASQRCLQELGMSGRVFAKDLLGSLSPGQSGGMDTYDVLGGYARTNNNGLSLGLLGGATAPEQIHDPCAGVDTPPAVEDIPESTIFQGNADPSGTAFDVGIGIHEYYLNQAAFAAFDGGMLCANVGTRSVALLNSDTFSILAPSLVDLLHGETAQLVLALRPQKKPVLTLGPGTFTTNSSGETVIDQPLITIELPQLQIDFYAMVDQRFVRLFTLQADVTLPLGIDVNDTGQLVPILGDVDNAFQNISVTNSELLAETPDMIAQKFPAVLSIALPFLADALGGFDLPSFLGIQIQIAPGGITSVDGNQLLAIFGNLAASGKPERRVDTWAEVVKTQVPSTEAFTGDHFDRAQRPVVELALGGMGADGTDRDLEWQYRLDSGLWSPYTHARDVRISREGFWLQGRHVVEVRAREAGLPDTTDREPVRLEFLVDTIAPQVSLTETPDGVSVEATDTVSAPEALRVEYRVGDGEWIAAGPAPAVIAIPPSRVADLEVRVTDEAGNASLSSGQVIDFHGRVPAGAGCGCRVGGERDHRGGTLPLVAIAIGVLVTLRLRRRRSLLPFAAVLLVAGATAACGGSGTGGDDTPDAGGVNPNEVQHGPIGRWSDIAADNGRVIVSAYEETYGDLVIGEVNTDSNNLKYTVIDGVPDGPVVLDPAGYRGGIKDKGEDVGAWTSIALYNGDASISYQDRDLGALKFAQESGGVWSSHVVDSGMGGTAGLYTSLSVGADGVPGIAYMAIGVDDGMGGKRAELRWAQASDSKPSSESDWTVTVLGSVHVPCANLCGDGNVCVASSETCAPVDSTCGDTCSGDTACVSGACVAILPDQDAVDLPEGTGLFASAGRLNDDRPVVAFYDRSTGDLELAVRDAGGAWSITPLDAADETDTGQWSSLAVAPDGSVHVAYQDALGDRLLHVSWNAGTIGPVEVIDDGDRSPDRPHPVGASASLVVDSQGNLVVVYQDQATSDLLAATNAGGTWMRSDVETGADGIGFFASAATDANVIWVSSYVYSRDIYPPGELRIYSLP